MTTPTTSERLTTLESERYRINVKLDDISTDVRALNHQVQAEIVPRLDGIDGRLDGIDGRLDGIDGRLNGIDGRLDGIERGQADLQRGVGALLAHFGITPGA